MGDAYMKSRDGPCPGFGVSAVFPIRIASLALIFAAVALSGLSGSLAHGDALDDKSREILSSWLNNVMQSAPIKEIKPQKVIPIENDDVKSVFPDDRFYGVYFASWPRPVPLPKELSHEMVARVRHGELVEPIRGDPRPEGLRSFLSQAFSDIHDDNPASAAVRASLRLAEAVAK